ncbi:Zn-dependent oxidoreductase [Mycolicibacterium phlei]|jgi:NADPH2:quinone reductase|uniref:Quinone oxidoreductase n=1 Tax=Mycolicibacterium phlei DSM 43239 = CCUG 21000 TaxID=1226750 RepID=A0A5N5UVV3_MYCPH|nr:quinone oxidoreductase [Mycolicibacterium phlei]VEG09810.1 Zn-dependent oxidoreductase [Mycobacteroides chelonae]AMO61703.1 Quinone oxidoreductase 1 [Mycolicibacterium phlei]KAB7753751.1 quinone oxidoreductase [Mycolicibacterium phlei DSM 43239 = CCUG 21000]KXW63184.1 quinone oxidoreductase [Mycolicibacterium phlei DSM 43239 = CCUG 21000]KXW63993.1 quinone oxidoreductase [Mycolicibacterium phlei DSM 43070]
MHAIEIAKTGGPDVLTYVDKTRPEPGPGQVLIKAEAIGVNFLDTYFRSGLYPRETPFVVGNEVCGTVAAVGEGVAALKVGDRVVTAQADGAYAEYSLAPADFVAYVPEGVSPDVAAASLLKGMTAHYLIKSLYPVQEGDAILVHAGAGGVGLILTQWATALAARVITTVSTPEKAELSRKAGAVEVLDYPEDPAEFGTKIKEMTGGGVAAVYDGVGKATFEASLASLRVRGTLALFGASSGPVPPFDPQRLNAAGSLFLTRPTLFHYTRTPDEFAWRAGELLDAIAAGQLNITVSHRYPLAEAEQAHRDLEGRRTVGSVVLIP